MLNASIHPIAHSLQIKQQGSLLYSQKEKQILVKELEVGENL